MQTRITFACDVCGKNFKYNHTKVWRSQKDILDAGRARLAKLGWHYVPFNESADGRTWELCNNQVCKKCGEKKLKTCAHSCQAKYETIKKGAAKIEIPGNVDSGPGGDQSDLVAMDYYTGLEKSGSQAEKERG